MNKLNLSKNLITSCIYTLALASSAVYAASCQNPTPVWADEFDGSSLDTSKWDVQIGDGCSYGICGWGNNELQSYQNENLTVGNGMLTITAKKQRVQSKNYTSGRIRTANMPNGGQWTNGRFEARIKLPPGSGMWPAFWMLPTDPDVGWPMSGEIDIVESVGQTGMFNFGTIHYGQAWPNNEWTQGRILTQPGLWSDDFHEYALEWEPNEIRWYIDDILYSTKTPADMSDSAYWTFEQYQYHLILNLAVGGNLGGTVDDSMLPQTMDVDYVRVYDFGQPSLTGEHIVAPNSTATYSVVDEAGNNSNYSWSAPTGQSGNSNSFTVNWGTESGQVILNGSNSCGSYALAMDVHVLPVQSQALIWDDFESNRNITYTYNDGAFVHSVANPASDGVNDSAVVAQYTRNSAALYDVIAADVGSIANLAAFKSGDNAFYLDVYTAAPVGTEILIQLEDASVATPDNYPNGRHSKYIAHTQVQNAWQRLRFTIEDVIDSTVADSAVDTLVVLIDPNTNNGDTYYLDNLSIYAPDGGSTGGNEASSMTVNAVSTGTAAASKGQKYGTATVNLVDNLGAGVAGADVTVMFSGSWSETVSGTTDGNGHVTLQTSTALGGVVTVNACVVSVTGGSLSFDGAASVGMCQ